jgi:hypothetical protein
VTGTRPNYRALLIGNSTFPDDPQNLPRLEGPGKDAALLLSALTHPEFGLFEPGEVRTVFERTKTEILVELDTFFGDATADDLLLLYYSGHGVLTPDNRLHLCARDTQVARPRATAVTTADLNAMIDNSRARTTVIVLDCCHSGSYKGSGVPEDLGGEGRHVLMSCRAGQLALDADRRNGTSLFTRHVVEGLLGATPDRDGDGYVDLVDVYDYVYRQLRAERGQLPERMFSGHGDIAIARRPTRPLPLIPTPPLVQTPPPQSAPPAETGPEAGVEARPPEVAADALAAIPEAGGVRQDDAGTPGERAPDQRIGSVRQAAVVAAAVVVMFAVGVLLARGGTDGGGGSTLASPEGIVLYDEHTAFVVDSGRNVVFRLALPTGDLTPVFTSGDKALPVGETEPVAAELHELGAIVVNGEGNLVFAADDRIYTGSPNGSALSFVPLEVSGLSHSIVRGLAYASDGDLLVSLGPDDLASGVYRLRDDATLVQVVGGDGVGFGGDNGPPTAARIKASAIATDDSGNLFIADTGNDRVREVFLNTIQTIAGNGADGYTGDEGRPLDASFGAPYGVTVAGSKIYVTDDDRVRVIEGDTIRTVTGTASEGYSGDDGRATSAKLNDPTAVAVAADGNVYVTDTGNHVVRRIDPQGFIHAVA